MRFKVARHDLEAALQIVDASMASSGSDISAHFVFRRTGPDKDDKYGIEVLTWVNRIFSSCPVLPVVVEDKGDKDTAFTVEGWRLKQWLQYIPPDSAPEFILADGEVTVRVKRGKQTFQSLDPSIFPYWDTAHKEATVKATVPADRLAAAFSYAKSFISDRETLSPEICVCEAKGSILYASDKKSAALILVPGMADSSLRVHGRDVAGFITFLGNLGNGNVEVLEHDRMVLLRRCMDGALFGESRFHYAFPFPKVKMDDTDQHMWALPAADLRQTIGFLVAGAVKDDNSLRLAPGENPGEVVVSMNNATGKVTALPLSGITMTSAPKAPEIPEEGFLLDHFILARVLSPWKAETIRFGLNVVGDKGFVRVVTEQYESKYLTIIPWLT